MKATADILAEAREYIDEHGWTRGTLLDQSGRVCALGGVVVSQDWLLHGEIAADHMADVSRVSNALLKVIHPKVVENPAALTPQYPGQWLTLWNDHHASGKQAVLDAFAKAEKIERTGFDPDEGVQV